MKKDEKVRRDIIVGSKGSNHEKRIQKNRIFTLSLHNIGIKNYITFL
jgi:hypothetical protein